MATMLHSDSRRLYSWWWDSHISPMNSKWLQENLTDMDTKVKSMIKLIEEDADSFARRAEMYYKKRPELMKLVEEFYRAYRALAERYDHATVELRQAHRTMVEAFPNQVPYLADDSSSVSSGPEVEPHTPEMPHPIRALFDPEDLQKDALGLSSTCSNSTRRHGGYSDESDYGTKTRGLKQLNDMFGSGTIQQKVAEGRMEKQEAESEKSLRNGYSQLSTGYKNLRSRALSESERACKAEGEIQALKKTLADLQAEKEAVHLQYQQSLQKLSSLERELNHAQIDAGGLSEQAIKAELEIEILKEALVKIEAERDAALLQYNQYLATISTLEIAVSKMQDETKGLNERAFKAEMEAQNLNQELSKLQDEKEAGLLQYKQCLEMISALKNKISLAEENAQMLNEQTERAETEVKALKQELYKLKEEKEDAILQYEKCLDTIGKLENEIARAQVDTERLNRKVMVGEAKLKSVEEQRAQLEKSNQSLQLEADNLAQKIAVKDQELFEKQSELDKLQSLLQDEQSQFSKIETALKNLQLLHSQSQEEQRTLTLELQNRLQMVKDLEIWNQNLENDIQQVKEEKQNLNEQNKSSTISLKILQNEISSLKEIKEKLEQEVVLQVDQSTALQEDVYHLQEEIKDLNRRYQALMEQVQSVGLNPEFIESSFKKLQHENSKLIEVCNKHRDEKDALYEKFREMDYLLQKKSVLEASLSESNAKLEGSREKVEVLQESCRFLRDEKSALIAEKATLLSQLQIMTENMQKLLERNILLETSLSGANVELEGLRVKSKNFEEFCQLLRDEKSDLLNERGALVSELINVEERLGNLEKRFMRLEEKCADLEKEKESTNFQVEELKTFLCLEKQERASFLQSSESRLANLENHLHLLQEECRSGKREFEEELDKAVKAQVEIFILQKFIEDLEHKNLSLLVERQKHIEASKLSDKLLSELESENLEQQVEAEFLLDEIENLRVGIYKVFRALQFDADCKNEDMIQREESRIPHILEDIGELKCSLSRNKDEKHQLLVENSVLLCLLQQLRLEGAELESEKKIIGNDLEIISKHHAMLNKDNHELLEMNRQLKLEVREGHQQEKKLKGELEAQHAKLGSLQEAYLVLQEQTSKALEENRLLVKRISDLRKEMCILEEENDAIFQEVVALGNISLVFQSFGTEKEKEIKAFVKDLNRLQVVNSELKQKVQILGEKLVAKDAENQCLGETVEKLHKDLDQANDVHGQLNHQILIGQDFLRQKAIELLEAQQKLKATQLLNAELCRTVEDLKRDCEQSKLDRGNIEKQIRELVEFSRNQKEEIEQLHEANKNLKSEVCILHKEVVEQRVREEYLSSELQEKTNEFELWESEAASFYFDLQISSIHEVLLENKVLELTGCCQSLENGSAEKSLEIQQMKEKVGSMESEIGGLKAQLSAYVPIIDSLRDTVESLEDNVLRTKISMTANGEVKRFFSLDPQVDYQHHKIGHQELVKDGITSAAGLSSLQEMQTRIRAITAVMEERDRLAVQTENLSVEKGGLWKEPDKLNKRNTSEKEIDIQKVEMELENELLDKLRQQRSKPEKSEMKNGLLMKDIQLDHASNLSSHGRSRKENGLPDDQMLELWESAEQDHTIDCIVSDTEEKANPPMESGVTIHQFKDAGHKSRDPCSELLIEKELGVDKLEVSASIRGKNQGGKGEKILERLASDAEKLVGLQRAVQGLKKDVEMKKRRKKANGIEYDRVKGQLQEVDEAIVQLADVNDQLAKEIEDSISIVGGKNFAEERNARDTCRKIAIEQARKGSEKIGRLQFEVRSIQYLLLKLEDENKHKGKNKLSESKTGVLLRDFIYKGSAHNSARRRKGCFCGCMRSSTKEE